jgi:hypothetical protein
MGKYLGTTLVLLLAAAALAAPNTTTAGPLSLYVDDMGVATICNDGAAPFTFDGYTLLSASGYLPADVLGINDNAWLDMVGFPATIGLTLPQAVAWTEVSATPSDYSEITMILGAKATLQPGDCINLGAGFDFVDRDDMTFTYVDSRIPASYEGFIPWSYPEPCDYPASVEIGGPYVWDITAGDTFSISAGGTANLVDWTI